MTEFIKNIFDHPQFEVLKQYDYEAPIGSWTGRLDHLAWGKSANLFCYFTDVATSGRHVLSVFANAAGYTPRQQGPDFKQEPTGGTYTITTSQSSRSRYRTFLTAQKLANTP